MDQVDGSSSRGDGTSDDWAPVTPGGERRRFALEAHLLSGAREEQAIAALEAELVEVLERLTAAEAALAAEGKELVRLRVEVDAARREGTGSAGPSPGPAAGNARQVELPGPGAVRGPEYWLGRCVGFRVDVQAGTIGIVEELRFASRHDCPDSLAVRVRRSRGLLLVAVEDVGEIEPESQRIVLRRDPRPELHPGVHPAPGPMLRRMLHGVHARMAARR